VIGWAPSLALAVGAAGAAGAVVRVQHLTAELHRRASVAEAIAALSHRTLAAEQPDELLSEALKVAVEVTRAEYGSAVRRLPDGRMRLAQELGPQPLAPGTILPLAPQGSYILQVVESGQAFVSADLRSDPRVSPPGPLLDRGIVSGLAVPVRGAHGVAGVLAVHSRRRRRFGAADVQVVTQLASVAATAWEQATQRQLLGHQALHDPLTGLPNRALFLDRLEHALARRPSSGGPQGSVDVAVVLVDLDGFKAVNDTLGHAAGDQLLTATAHRLRDVVRPQDTIARLGGDEFALLCEPAPDDSDLVRLTERMQAACSQPLLVSGSTMGASASFGISRSGRMPDEVPTAAVLLGEADVALYGAKNRGRGQVQIFDEQLQHSTRRRRQLEAELEAALEHDQFRLHYQPIRRPGDLHAVGVEALLRWQHPSQGLLAPGRFLRVAEETGLIVALGAWVLRAAATQAAMWQQGTAPSGAPRWIAVNVSPRQLNDRALADTVASVLLETGLAPETLALELTESAVLNTDDDHRAALARLRETGAQLFLDDFGTGYSSLTHLIQLPIQAVKIDRSFVAGLPAHRRNRAVVSSLIALSAELGLGVVAEGVETTQQLRALEDLRCPAMQGFLFDHPLAEPSLEPAVLLE